MERHDTHLLSCSSSMEHSYKFDKNGNLILDSLNSLSFSINKKNNKIKTSEIFRDINNRNENTIKEEDDLDINNNINDNINDNNQNININFSKNKNLSFAQKENKEDNKKNNNNENDNKNNFNEKENSFGDKDKFIEENNKYNNNLSNNEKFQIISSNQNFMYSPSGEKNQTKNKMNNTNFIINKNRNIIKKVANLNYIVKKYDEKDLNIIKAESFYLKSLKYDEKKNLFNNKYEYRAKFTERMKFSSKANSFLTPINDIIKEKDIFIKSNKNDIKCTLNINLCYFTKSPLILKYKINNKSVINKFSFYTKELINNEKNKDKIIKENKILLKNKIKINDDVFEKGEDNCYKNNVDNNDKDKDDDNIIKKNNDIDNDKEYLNIINEDNSLLNNNNINNEKDNINHDDKNEINNNNNNSNNSESNKHSMNKNNSNTINKSNIKDISKISSITNNLLLSPKSSNLNNNRTMLKPLNIHTTKKPKIPINFFPTPYNREKNKNTIEKNQKTFHKINQINTPAALAKKNIIGNKLFHNDSNSINNRQIIKEEKKNRNKSLVNIINYNCHHNLEYELEEKNNIEDLINNKAKKYSRHFGKEENCPICVALQMKNKFMEEKNILPILTKNNTINKSPNKNTVYKNNGIKEKMRRIMSSKPENFRKKVMKRTESVKEMRNINNDKLFEIMDINERFPALNAYFNMNKYN